MACTGPASARYTNARLTEARSWRTVSSGLENRRLSSTEGVDEMEIKRIGSQPSVKGPSEWFTGTVRIDPLFQAPDPAFVQGASVTFEPSARTAWHTHPLGQTLIVTAGCGWAQCEGGRIEEIRPRGRGLVLARREALARSNTDHGDDAHRHSGSTQRQSCGLDGKGQRRTIPRRLEVSYRWRATV